MSIIDILILHFAAKYGDVPVRNTLRSDVNLLLSPDSAISPSSFYHSLKKLEQKDLIGFTPSRFKRTKGISITPKGLSYIKQIAQITIGGITPSDYPMDQAIPSLLRFTDKESYENLLLVNFSEVYDKTIYRVFQNLDMVKNIFLLTSPEIYSNYKTRGMENYKPIFLSNNKIICEDLLFDGCLITRYQKFPKIVNFSRESLFNEIFRAMKTQGRILLQSYAALEKTSNIFYSQFSTLFQENPFYYSSSPEEMVNDLKNAGFSSINYENRDGFLFGWGTKTE